MINYKRSVLIACEHSQIVTSAFRKKGIAAYSCDILPGNISSEWHLQGDVMKWINCPWAMIIAFPPCTYVSSAGSRHLYDKNHKIKDASRLKKGIYGKELFLQFYHNKCNYIAIENPGNNKIFGYPKPSYYFNPCEYGHDYSKKSYLWLKNLPPILSESGYININYKKNSVKYLGDGYHRSIFHEYVAACMANQWGELLLEKWRNEDGKSNED